MCGSGPSEVACGGACVAGRAGNGPRASLPRLPDAGPSDKRRGTKKGPSEGPDVVNLHFGRRQTLNEEPHPQDAVALGLLNTNPRPMISSLKSTVTPPR